MIRLLAAILLTVAFFLMEPAARASEPAMRDGAAMTDGTRPLMAGGSQTRCTGGYPCILGCAGCLLAPASRSRKDFSKASEADTDADTVATFDLSWRLYRPPKSE